MEPKIKRRIAIGASGLAIFGGAGGAYAINKGSGGEDERRAFVDDAAERLDVSPGQLRSALRGAFEDRLDAAVRDGRLTRKQADEIKRHTRRNGGAGPPGPPGRVRFHGGPPMPGVRAAAKYLGLSNAELRKEVRSGKSLAQVAKDRGKSVEGLKEAVKKALAAKLDDHVDRIVDHTGPPGPLPGARGHRFRMRAPGPPPPGF